METIAEQLGKYAATLRYEDLPSEVVHQVKRVLVDTVGCVFGGYDSEPAAIARELAGLTQSSTPATVLCSGQKTSLELATFANDVMARYLDFNDGYVSKSGGHPSDSVAPVLAAAEVRRATGKDLIVGIVIAYETFCRICDAWDNKSCGIDHTTIGGIASLTGASRVLGLTEGQITSAVNIMVAGNVGLNQTRVGNVSKWKGSAYANASRNAVFAAQLAARGMTGPSPIFEGRNGFFNVVSRGPFELAPLGARGGDFRIMQCHLKRFPLGNFSQTVVTAVLEARKAIRSIDDIEEVYIRVSPRAINTMADGPEKWAPQNRETADHSIPYTAAVALMYGTIDEGFFEEKHFLHNKDLLRFMQRIKCSAWDEQPSTQPPINTWNLCDVEITRRSGERTRVASEYHRGHWRNPMTDEEIESKYHGLVGDHLPRARASRLLEVLWSAEKQPDVSGVIEGTLL